MADFQFLQNPLSKKWVILAPRRAKRPDMAKGTEPVCPFCPGKEGNEKEAYRVGGRDTDSKWQVRVLPNKFPFAPIHEIVILSPDHHKSFGELSLPQVELILKVYRQRYNLHKDKGQVYIFHNHGVAGGESLPHPHTQLAVIPAEINLEMPRLATPEEMKVAARDQVFKETNHFVIFCPKTSQWPDEVWVAPKERGNLFASIKDPQISDLAFALSRLIQIFDLRHGLEFPYNFYIYPGGDWYLRIIPRVKVLGGFEVGTGIMVNTQDPQETIEFIKEHFDHPDEEEIKTIHRATYHKEGV
ncbi:MAG: GalP transf protein [Candidatus Levybacteria bacterium]|nr:GalP transf protein [Candidatus Levybacteria bacterium]